MKVKAKKSTITKKSLTKNKKKTEKGEIIMPQDPIILLSYVNTKLRDNFPSLEELCKSEGIDKAVIIEKLSTVGYEYDEGMNKFI